VRIADQCWIPLLRQRARRPAAGDAWLISVDALVWRGVSELVATAEARCSPRGCAQPVAQRDRFPLLNLQAHSPLWRSCAQLPGFKSPNCCSTACHDCWPNRDLRRMASSAQGWPTAA